MSRNAAHEQTHWPPHRAGAPCLAERLESAASFLAAELVSDAALREISDLARLIPLRASSYAGFECRLAGDTQTADFLVRLRRDEPGPAMIAGRMPGAGRLREACKPEIWQHLQDFCHRWLDRSSPLHAKVNNLWLEFDLASGATAPFQPRVFFGTHESLYAGCERGAQNWLFDEALARLLGRVPGRALVERVIDAIARLPAEAQVFQVGALSTTTEPLCRLCILDIDPRQCADYLAAIGWGGDLAGLERVLAGVQAQVDYLALGVDINSTVRSKLGVECYVSEHNSDSRSQFLAHLVAAGHCAPDKGDAVMAWLANDPVRDAGKKQTRIAVRRTGHLAPLPPVRTLNHVKLVYEAGQHIEAKAYLGVRPPRPAPRAAEQRRWQAFFSGARAQQ